MEEKHPVFTGLALSSEAHILWGLSNFFLQLFIWGLPTGLFLFWTATFWEGFFVLAFLTGLAGIIVAVVPLWVVLYPRSLQKRPFQWPDWVKGVVVIIPAIILFFLVLLAANR